MESWPTRDLGLDHVRDWFTGGSIARPLRLRTGMWKETVEYDAMAETPVPAGGVSDVAPVKTTHPHHLIPPSAPWASDCRAPSRSSRPSRPSRSRGCAPPSTARTLLDAPPTPSTRGTRVYKRGAHGYAEEPPYSVAPGTKQLSNLLREELPVQVSADEDDLRHRRLTRLPLRLRRPEINLFVDSLKNELLIALAGKAQRPLLR